jgi:hypothetical protein
MTAESKLNLAKILKKLLMYLPRPYLASNIANTLSKWE